VKRSNAIADPSREQYDEGASVSGQRRLRLPVRVAAALAATATAAGGIVAIAAIDAPAATLPATGIPSR